ncbi:MAG TPA: TonB-dependent receptor [Steroidobacteraceae bacterium]|nr:TonB-dependent receptor [Steroidobacteraceae bacterium]
MRGSSKLWCALLAVPLTSGAWAVDTTAAEDLSRLSLQELANVQITSVSKSPEPLRRAPANVYVITHDDIVRSGATSIAEVLRLAPNLQVTQLTASSYQFGAGGFGGQQQAQNFANKLLILVDGRSVYSPLYSGVYADTVDLMLEDVDRIEVISGPGGTLWGANAMQGVINIITRASYLTRGTLVSAGAGNEEQIGSARYGDKLGQDGSFRVYGMSFHRGADETADHSSAHDGWSKGQGGFRADWTLPEDEITFQGDAYRGTENQPGTLDTTIVGANLLTRWRHQWGRADLQVQAYYDDSERYGPAGGGGFLLRTYDLEVQQNWLIGSLQHLVWGAGERLNDYEITNAQSLLFVPASRKLTLGDVFAQDTVSIGKSVQVGLGLKFEDDPYSGWTALPDLRVSWDLGAAGVLWAAAAKGVRSPTPFDVDVQEKIGPLVYLTGNPGFTAERVKSYELGYRVQPASFVSFSISPYYNVYDDLRTIEFGSTADPLPLHWGNLMSGATYGVSAWGNIQVMDWWRLSPSFSVLHKNLRFDAGASGILGLGQAGDDPRSQAGLTSSMNISPKLTFDASLRYVGSLPDPGLPAYTELTARLGWQVARTLELSLSGTNLLRAYHEEYPAPAGAEIGRGVMVGARWTPQ